MRQSICRWWTFKKQNASLFGELPVIFRKYYYLSKMKYLLGFLWSNIVLIFD